MATICMSTREVARAIDLGDHWIAYLEYTGVNHSNKSGQSAKWWRLEGHGSRPATVSHGRIGHTGVINGSVSGPALYKRVTSKILDGYVFRAPASSAPETRPAPLAHLPAPFNAVHALRRVGQSPLVEALDKMGSLVCMLSADTAEDLMGKYPSLRVGS